MRMHCVPWKGGRGRWICVSSMPARASDLSQNNKKGGGRVQLLLLFHTLWYQIKTKLKKITTHKYFIDNFNYRKIRILLHDFLYVKARQLLWLPDVILFFMRKVSRTKKKNQIFKKFIPTSRSVVFNLWVIMGGMCGGGSWPLHRICLRLAENTGTYIIIYNRSKLVMK